MGKKVELNQKISNIIYEFFDGDIYRITKSKIIELYNDPIKNRDFQVIGEKELKELRKTEKVLRTKKEIRIILNNIKGISCLKPNGAFYVFPSCKKLLGKKTKLKTDSEFVKKLLEKANVAVVQGSAFGLDGYFRISYATSMEKLKIAMERIKSFCENLS